MVPRLRRRRPSGAPDDLDASLVGVRGRIRDWQVYGPGDVIATPYGDIDVDACCDAVDRSATTT